MKIKKGYTLIELVITMTIVGLMAILGIIAFQGYGKSAIFEQKISKIESMIEQTNLLSKNPQKNINNYCLILENSKLTLYKGQNKDCKVEKVLVRQVDFSSGIKIKTDSDEFQTSHFLSCSDLGNDCYLKLNADLEGKVSLNKKTFFFSLVDNYDHQADFYLSIKPFKIDIER